MLCHVVGTLEQCQYDRPRGCTSQTIANDLPAAYAAHGLTLQVSGENEHIVMHCMANSSISLNHYISLWMLLFLFSC